MRTPEYIVELCDCLIHSKGKDLEHNRKRLVEIIREYGEEQLKLHIVGVTLKDKHKTSIIEYKRLLKELDNDNEMFLDNREEWIKQTSIIEGKLSVLENL